MAAEEVLNLPSVRAYTAWVERQGLVPWPAPPGAYAGYLATVRASGGPFAERRACGELAMAAGGLGVLPPLCATGTVEVPSATDYGRAVSFGGIGQAHDLGRISCEGKCRRRFARERRVREWFMGGASEGRLERCVDRCEAGRERMSNLRRLFALGAGGGARLGALSPQFRVSLGASAHLLEALVAMDMDELRAGVPPIDEALWSGRLRYNRADPGERWQTIGQIWKAGGGDCEDLAAAVCARRRLEGKPCTVVMMRSPSGGRTLHAVVRDTATGRLLDPSATGGMGWRE